MRLRRKCWETRRKCWEMAWVMWDRSPGRSARGARLRRAGWPGGRSHLGFYPAVRQIDDAVTTLRVRHRMRHLYDGRPFLVQLLEQVHDLLPLAGMQVPGRLVGKDQFRARDH